MSAHLTVAEHAVRLVERAPQVALCLDFDGTLSPIVEDPAAARPLQGIVELLYPLAARFAAVAVISGHPGGQGVRRRRFSHRRGADSGRS